MLRTEPAVDQRELHSVTLEADLVVVGGGLAGVCAAVTAARQGLEVVLLHDRPVLGGNSSSEIRLWVLGATSHMGSNNRWARESGVVDEVLVENLYRNREGNAVLFDLVLLDLVAAEPRLTVLLNTPCHAVTMAAPGTIGTVEGFCAQNSTRYRVTAPLFCDASGDGVLGYLAGAAFRVGAEAAAEFDEPLAPDEEFGSLLGHSLYFYSRDTGQPVTFVPPSYALTDITGLPRWRSFNAQSNGLQLWWLEWGGRGDTVHDTEAIKWELWRVALGVWHHIKNSGQFPDAANLTLEWLGQIPGKRESRRFEGDTWLTQRDIIEQRQPFDAVGYGGWSIDLHPADGVYGSRPSSYHWHSRGVYPIPFRTLYSRNVGNLLLAGRIVGSSHVAFGSTRVMGTCAHSAQAVGLAAALCRRHDLLPRDLLKPPRLTELQQGLLRAGQFIPHIAGADPADLARQAQISASSSLQNLWLPADGPLLPLEVARAQMIPLKPGPVPTFTLTVCAEQATVLTVRLLTSDRPTNHTPDVELASCQVAVGAGDDQAVEISFDVSIDQPRYVFLAVEPAPGVALRGSQQRLTGVLALARRGRQAGGQGVEGFDFWCPGRRPGGHNLALASAGLTTVFAPANVVDGFTRPTDGPHAWVAGYHDPRPTLTFTWPQPMAVQIVQLSFDTDFDHAMESVFMPHCDGPIPFCVKGWRLLAEGGRELAAATDNHQTRRVVELAEPIVTQVLQLEVTDRWSPAPAAVFEVRVYGP
ncbi:MAG: FAD-dependent oxidoreductase [Fimbriimonadaceae bacterium]|nr:FAD-dependent oxidoreductase [Fimbriimonadaceae bacterium]